MALSTMRKLLGLQYLRLGCGLVATPMSRRKERLFGVADSGRSKNERVLHILGGVEIPVREDTCIRAFVRLLREMGEIASEMS